MKRVCVCVCVCVSLDVRVMNRCILNICSSHSNHASKVDASALAQKKPMEHPFPPTIPLNLAPE